MRILGWIATLTIAAALISFLVIDSVGGGTTADVPDSAAAVVVPTVTAPAPTPSGNAAVDALRASVPVPDVQVNPPASARRGPRFAIATVKPGRKIALHASPGGRVLKQVGPRTEFGSTRVFWIERVSGAWFGVPTPDLPDGKLAWIKDDRFALDLSQTRFWISADISRRLLRLHYGNRVLQRIRVTVGSQSTPTPLGNYSVTDGLVGRGIGPWYGCCVLALSGHQSNLPSGWIGGNRIAIHGTPGSVGGADSHGCLRASDPDMIYLFARVPLGAPVFIRA
jgi:lipoprotein-anchoring transpeptidase ErfK/SrfK